MQGRMETTWRIWAVHRRLYRGLGEANQQQAGLGWANQHSSGLDEANQHSSGLGEANQRSSGLDKTNQRSSGLGEANQHSSGLRESAQNRSTVWPVSDQHCIWLKAGLLRDQSKVQDRVGQSQVDEGRSRAGVTGPACVKRSTRVSQCAIRGELARCEVGTEFACKWCCSGCKMCRSSACLCDWEFRR